MNPFTEDVQDMKANSRSIVQFIIDVKGIYGSMFFSREVHWIKTFSRIRKHTPNTETL